MNEQLLLRTAMAVVAGSGAAAASGVVALLAKAVRRDVGLAVPAMSGLSVAVTVFVIDWLTERQGRPPSPG